MDLYYIGSVADQWTGSGMEIVFDIEYDDNENEFIMDCEVSSNSEDWAILTHTEAVLEYTKDYISRFKGKGLGTIEEVDAILKEELGRDHGASKTIDDYYEVW